MVLLCTGVHYMGAIVGVEDCLLLVINGDWLDILENGQTVKEWIGTIAIDLKIPVYFAQISMNKGEHISDAIDQVAALNIDGRRKRLLIAGLNLEDAITFGCLEALAYGFDVFLLIDLIDVLQPNLAALHWDRLLQAGAVPSSFGQVLNEWAFCSTDSSQIEKIEFVAREFKKLKISRAPPLARNELS